jgi:hypothetical protein
MSFCFASGDPGFGLIDFHFGSTALLSVNNLYWDLKMILQEIDFPKQLFFSVQNLGGQNSRNDSEHCQLV